MLLVKVSGGEVEKFPISLSQFKLSNPNVSFPESISDETFSPYGFYRVFTADQPDFDQRTQECVKGTTPALVDGNWVIGYTVSSLSTAEASIRVRSHRAGMLEQTDWWALSDVTMSASQQQYRNLLRAIPEQSGFPFSVSWPVKPV